MRSKYDKTATRNGHLYWIFYILDIHFTKYALAWFRLGFCSACFCIGFCRLLNFYASVAMGYFRNLDWQYLKSELEKFCCNENVLTGLFIQVFENKWAKMFLKWLFSTNLVTYISNFQPPPKKLLPLTPRKNKVVSPHRNSKM